MKKRFCVDVFVIVFSWIPYWLALYPGIVAYDIKSQVQQYFFESGYNEWHPIFHTKLMGGLISLGNAMFGNMNRGMAFYTLVQLIILAISAAYAISVFGEIICNNRWIYLLIFAYFTFFPVFPILAISTTKDVLFSAAFLMSFTLLFQLNSGKDVKMSLFFSIVLSVLLRNNSIYCGILFTALSFLLYLFCVKFFFAEERIRWMKVFLLIFAFALSVGMNLLTLEKEKNDADPAPTVEKMSVPIQHLGFVYNKYGESLDDDILTDILYFWSEESLESYQINLSDPLKFSINLNMLSEKKEVFWECWKQVLIRYPFDCVYATMMNVEPLWNISKKSFSSIPGVYLETSIKEIDGLELHRTSKIKWLENFIYTFFWEGKINEVPFLRALCYPAVYVWILVVCIMILIAIKDKLIIPVMYALAYVSTLVMGPCILPRYCLCIFMISPLVMGYTISRLSEMRNLFTRSNVKMTNKIEIK